MKLTYLEVIKGQILIMSHGLIYQLTTSLGILTKVKAPRLHVFISLQAPSGGRKQNCRFTPVCTTVATNTLFPNCPPFNMLFKEVLHTSEECLDCSLNKLKINGVPTSKSLAASHRPIEHKLGNMNKLLHKLKCW